MPLILTPRKLDQRAQFYHQFGQLTSAGISVVKALEMLLQNPPARSFREPLTQMLGQLTHGATVTDAMRHLGRWMPSFDIALVEAGEKSGRLDTIFKLLAGYYTDRAVLVRRTMSDLAYPALTLHAAVFIFPFITFVRDGNVTFYLLKTFGTLAVLYTIVFGLMYAAQARRGTAWRALMEKILRPVPVLGKARHALALARLAVALEALINAGVNIIQAWEMAAPASGSPAIQSAVLAWRPRLDGGQTPAEAVKNCPLFPDVFANLYYSGEVSGQLDESLRRLHNYYQDEGSRKMHLLAQWVPRGIYFLIALIIAYKIISFYLGYFNMLNDIMK
jgi:type II secretory pathway component PulF